MKMRQILIREKVLYEQLPKTEHMTWQLIDDA